MGLEEQFAAIKRDEEIKELRLGIAGLRQVISCAVCAHCNDPIADRKWDIDGAERLVHKDCLADIDRENAESGVTVE